MSGTVLHIIFTHHESYEACVDGFWSGNNMAMFLAFAGVPSSSIWIRPFARSMDAVETAYAQGKEHFQTICTSLEKFQPTPHVMGRLVACHQCEVKL